MKLNARETEKEMQSGYLSMTSLSNVLFPPPDGPLRTTGRIFNEAIIIYGN